MSFVQEGELFTDTLSSLQKKLLEDVGKLTPVFIEDIVRDENLDYLEHLAAMVEKMNLHTLWFENQTKENKTKLLQIFQISLNYEFNVNEIYGEALLESTLKVKQTRQKNQNFRRQIVNYKNEIKKAKNRFHKRIIERERRKQEKLIEYRNHLLHKVKMQSEVSFSENSDSQSTSQQQKQPQVIYVPCPYPQYYPNQNPINSNYPNLKHSQHPPYMQNFYPSPEQYPQQHPQQYPQPPYQPPYQPPHPHPQPPHPQPNNNPHFMQNYYQPQGEPVPNYNQNDKQNPNQNPKVQIKRGSPKNVPKGRKILQRTQSLNVSGDNIERDDQIEESLIYQSSKIKNSFNNSGTDTISFRNDKNFNDDKKSDEIRNPSLRQSNYNESQLNDCVPVPSLKSKSKLSKIPEQNQIHSRKSSLADDDSLVNVQLKVESNKNSPLDNHQKKKPQSEKKLNPPKEEERDNSNYLQFSNYGNKNKISDSKVQFRDNLIVQSQTGSNSYSKAIDNSSDIGSPQKEKNEKQKQKQKKKQQKASTENKLSPPEEGKDDSNNLLVSDYGNKNKMSESKLKFGDKILLQSQGGSYNSSDIGSPQKEKKEKQKQKQKKKQRERERERQKEKEKEKEKQREREREREKEREKEREREKEKEREKVDDQYGDDFNDQSPRNDIKSQQQEKDLKFINLYEKTFYLKEEAKDVHSSGHYSMSIGSLRQLTIRLSRKNKQPQIVESIIQDDQDLGFIDMPLNSKIARPSRQKQSTILRKSHNVPKIKPKQFSVIEEQKLHQSSNISKPSQDIIVKKEKSKNLQQPPKAKKVEDNKLGLSITQSFVLKNSQNYDDVKDKNIQVLADDELKNSKQIQEQINFELTDFDRQNYIEKQRDKVRKVILQFIQNRNNCSIKQPFNQNIINAQLRKGIKKQNQKDFEWEDVIKIYKKKIEDKKKKINQRRQKLMEKSLEKKKIQELTKSYAMSPKRKIEESNDLDYSQSYADPKSSKKKIEQKIEEDQSLKKSPKKKKSKVKDQDEQKEKDKKKSKKSRHSIQENQKKDQELKKSQSPKKKKNKNKEQENEKQQKKSKKKIKDKQKEKNKEGSSKNLSIRQEAKQKQKNKKRVSFSQQEPELLNIKQQVGLDSIKIDKKNSVEKQLKIEKKTSVEKQLKPSKFAREASKNTGYISSFKQKSKYNVDDQIQNTIKNVEKEKKKIEDEEFDD